MKITINKRHPANGNKFFTICNYGYFRPKGEWELISIKFIGLDIMIYRKSIYKKKWPVSCA